MCECVSFQAMIYSCSLYDINIVIEIKDNHNASAECHQRAVCVCELKVVNSNEPLVMA